MQILWFVLILLITVSVAKRMDYNLEDDYEEGGEEDAGQRLKCYKCTSKRSESDLSCTEFDTEPRWSPFEVLCPAKNYCTKSIHPINGVVRGCGSHVNSSGRQTPEGCHKADGSDVTLCMCSTNYCNTSNSVLVPTYGKLFVWLHCLLCYFITKL